MSEPRDGVTLTTPKLGPCPKCGHDASGITVTLNGVSEDRPHQCCGHPDCMTEDAMNVREGQSALRGAGDTPPESGKVKTALALFRSVIQSGEPWTVECQSAYDAAMDEAEALS